MSGGGADFATSTSDIPERYRGFVDQTLDEVTRASNLGPEAFRFGYAADGGAFTPQYDEAGNVTNLGQKITGGQAQIAGFSPDQQAAFQQTRAGQGQFNPLYEAAQGTAYDIGAGQSAGQQAAYNAINQTNAIPGMVQPLYEGAAGAAYDISGGQDLGQRQAQAAAQRALQLSNTSGAGQIGNFMNPYEDQVVQRGIDDMTRAQAQQAENLRLGAAGRGAFGSQGDLAQTEAQRNFLDRVGNFSAQTRSQGFGQAAGLAQQDLSRQANAVTQGGQLGLGGAQSRLSGSNALANQATQRGQLGLSAAGQAGQLGLGADAQRLNAANSLSNIAGQRQDYRMSDINALAAQGANQQALQQAMIDADMADFAQQANLPFQQIGLRLGALGQAPMGGVTTQPVQKPDRFGQLLGAGAQIGAAYTGACWVAREVYGEDNPRWVAFRGYLLTEAPAWFRKLYIKHGERFAEWVANKPKIKGVIRRLMDKAIEG
jgi:hypothetical protein